MEYIVEKIGMSRTIATKSTPVTLLKLVEAKVCEIDENKRAIVAYAHTKANNKAIAGQQKKYNLTAEFNKFATLEVANSEVGNVSRGFLDHHQNHVFLPHLGSLYLLS